MGIISEFKEFLNEYKIMGLAVAFIMATTTISMVNALVNDILMPLIKPVLAVADSNWKTATFGVGPIQFLIGDFISAVINFLIMAWVVFMIAKFVMKEKKVAKK